MMKKPRIYAKMNSIVGDGPDKKSYLGADDFVRVRHRNILVSYHVRNRLVDLARLLGTIRRILEKLEAALEVSLEQVEVEIYQNRSEWIEKHTCLTPEDTPSWVQADSDRLIRIVMDRDRVDGFAKLQLMVTHECVHLAVRRVSMGLAPAWLDEGLAVWMSQELPDVFSRILKQAVTRGATLPIALLQQPFARFDRRMKDLAYAQSASMVEFLIGRYGWNAIRNLLAAVVQGTPEKGLTPFGLNDYLLEKEWLRHVS